MLNPHEKSFMHSMREIAQMQEAYANSGPRRDHGLASRVKDYLKVAGRTLGYNARFLVWGSGGRIHIEPKNGSGERMLARYHELELQQELGGYD